MLLARSAYASPFAGQRFGEAIQPRPLCTRHRHMGAEPGLLANHPRPRGTGPEQHCASRLWPARLSFSHCDTLSTPHRRQNTTSPTRAVLVDSSLASVPTGLIILTGQSDTADDPGSLAVP